MKKFLLNIIGYLVISIVSIFFVALILWLKDSKPDINWIKTEVVAVGDSHLLTSVKDSLNISNQSFSGETYEEVFYRIKRLKLIEADTVLIGFSYNNIDPSVKENMMSTFTSKKRFYKSFFVLGKEFVANNYNNLPSYSILIANIRDFLISRGQSKYSYSGFEKRIGSIVTEEECENKISEHYSFNITSDTLLLWKKNLHYLNIILSDLKEDNSDKQVFLVSAPFTSCYYANIPVKVFEGYNDLTKSLSQKYDVRYLNYSALGQIMPNEIFQNSDHLNYKGAQWFTRQVKADIKKGKSIIYTPADSLKLEPFYLN